MSDATGATLADKLPLPKLKVIPALAVPADEEDKRSTELERIVSHKTVHGKQLFLVKWKKTPASENSWLAADAFDDRRMINAYLRSLPRNVDMSSEQSPLPPPVRGKPSKELPKEMPTRFQPRRGTTMMLSIFCSLIFLPLVFSCQ